MSYMMLNNGYQEGTYVCSHPFGDVVRIFKEEYGIRFEKCVIKGHMSEDIFYKVHSLKYCSYIVEYESNQDIIILENIYELPKQMTAIEVKKMILDLLHAIEVLQQHHLSLEHVHISQIYKTKQHYKLDCYNIGNASYQTLIQDICEIGLNIIDQDNGKLRRVLYLYTHQKYQDPLKQIIRIIEQIPVSECSYTIEQGNYQKPFIVAPLIYYVWTHYTIVCLVILLTIIIYLL